MRVVALLLCLLWGQAWGATYYVRPACANNGNGTASDCAASAGAAGAYNVMSSITSSADGQVELARGNTVYLIGSSAAAWNPGGVGTGDGASDFILRGDHADGAGGFDGGGSVAILSNIGGASRNTIKYLNLYFRNATGNCLVLGNGTNTNTGITFSGLDIDTCGTSGIQITGPATTVLVSSIDCAGIGDTADESVACVNSTPAAGVAVSGLAISSITCAGNGLGRYCVNLYPPTTGGATGTIPSPKITTVRCTGAFTFSCVNWINDVDNAVVSDVDTTGSTSPAQIHFGGQGTIGACPVTTDGAIVRDSIATGGLRNAYQPGDGQGFYPDECSTTWLGERILAYGNDVAGIFLNDSDTGTLRGSISFGNGANALNVHGLSNGNTFENNTFAGIDPYSVAGSDGISQGLDVVQQDSTSGNTTANVYRNNAILGNSAKCFDVDGDPSYATESHTSVYGCPTLSEGYTPDASDLDVEQGFIGGTSPTTAAGVCLESDSALLGAGTYIGAYVLGYGGESLTNPPPIGARGLCQPRRASATRRAAGTRVAN